MTPFLWLMAGTVAWVALVCVAVSLARASARGDRFAVEAERLRAEFNPLEVRGVRRCAVRFAPNHSCIREPGHSGVHYD